MLLRLATQLPGRLANGSTFSSSLKQALLAPRLVKPSNNNVLVRQYARGSREPPVTARGEVRRGPTLKEKLMGPPSENAYSMGKGAVAGAAGIGLGALCYYGVGLSKDASIHNNSILWPQYVRERLHTTYGYFGASCVLTALTAAAVFRSPRLLELTTRNGWLCLYQTYFKQIYTTKELIETTDTLLLFEEMEKRYLENPYPDYVNKQTTPLEYDEEHVKNLICTYVDAILEHCRPGCDDEDHRGDLYVGNAGIAYMFWKMARSSQCHDLYPALEHAHAFIRNAKANADRYKKRSSERYSFLCGNAGIYAVSAAISHDLKLTQDLSDDLMNFKSGIAPSKEFMHTKYGCDEILVGRAGYLSGCYWLNDVLTEKKITDDDVLSICQMIIASGREYAKQTKAPLPLMYQYHGTEYLGAAHGLCAILHMLLDSPWFQTETISAPSAELRDIKRSIDFFLMLQDEEGNFPVALEDLKSGREKRLVHWCHGAPGAVYLLAKAYLIFKEDKYMQALKKSADLVWHKGFLRKGPGICHGVAGNGYVFLLLYRLTHEPVYLYRAIKYMELLSNSEFRLRARTPDRPHSLYEGVAGTVCYLIDLLEPDQAYFPFMDVFH